MGGGKAPPPPDYGPIAAANKEAAEVSAAVSREQLAWAKEQYQKDYAANKEITDAFLPGMKLQMDAAQKDRARYEQVYQPLEDQLAKEAADYSTPERQQAEAAKAVAAVDTQYDAARKAAEANLQSYGMDPSQIRSGALDLGTRVSEAAAKAGADTTARTNVENVGRALRSEAINIGKGYPGNVAGAVQTATQTGQAGQQANLATTASGSQTMGTPVQWAGMQNQSLGNWGDLASRTYASQLQYKASQGSGIWGALGSVAGAGFGALMKSDPRSKENMRQVGTLDDGTPVYAFNYKEGEGGGPTQLGVSADDVQQTNPDAVGRMPDGMKGVDYEKVADRAQGAVNAGRNPGDPYTIDPRVLERKGTEFFDRLHEKTLNPGAAKKGGGKAQQAQAPRFSADELEALLSGVMAPQGAPPAQMGA